MTKPPTEPRYVDLEYIAKKLKLPIETVRYYHKRATRSRREGRSATSWRMPKPDAPIDAQSLHHPRWLRETADAYIAAKRSPRHEAAETLARRLRERHAETTDEMIEQAITYAWRLRQIGEGSTHPVAPQNPLGRPVMVRLSKTERKLAGEALASIASDLRPAIDEGPRGWSVAMAPDRADEIAAALMKAWREHDQPVYELAVRFAEDRVPARRTKRGGWAAGVG